MLLNAARRAEFEVSDNALKGKGERAQFVDHIPSEDESNVYRSDAYDLAKQLHGAKAYTKRFYTMLSEVIKRRADFERFLDAKLGDGSINLERDRKHRSQYPSFAEEDLVPEERVEEEEDLMADGRREIKLAEEDKPAAALQRLGPQLANPDIIKGMDAVDLFCARNNIQKSKLTSSEAFAIKHENRTARLSKHGCWWFLFLLVIILLFEMLAAPLVFDVNCTEPLCILIPPSNGASIKFPQGLKANMGSMMNMSWNSSHIVMETQCGA